MGHPDVFRLFGGGGGGFGAYGADCLIDDDVEKLVVVGLGFGLDHEAHAPAGCGGIGECECRASGLSTRRAAGRCRRRHFILAAQLPGVVDGGGDDLVEGVDLSGWVSGGIGDDFGG